ncbi:threonine/serine exporter family protein [Dongshaea marina]|uniref:threonine/serine exporter family protein n=1 Tax=Dongshaea marina TaxID=2047966 RepID=UPI000D3E847D|nr:threonine/serine exporter family protein [Dongshaea marina]
MKTLPTTQAISQAEQIEITQIIIKAGQLLAWYGAESRIIEQTTCRLGAALGIEKVEMAISSSALVLTTLHQGQSHTTTRRVSELGINMHMVCEIQRICIMAEKGVLSLAEVRQRLYSLKPYFHNRWALALMIGLSCAAFSQLFGGDWPVFGWTFISATLGMLVRQELTKRHFNPLIVFGGTAYVTTLIASLASRFAWGEHPYLVMASSVLLLVPGFPLVSGVDDMVKGYFNMGWGRLCMATLIVLNISIGIVLAMVTTSVWGG